MGNILNPYINFQGNAREAIEFYHSVMGGKLDVTTYGEFKMSQKPEDDGKIMHAQLTTDSGMVLMVSDTLEGMPFLACVLTSLVSLGR